MGFEQRCIEMNTFTVPAALLLEVEMEKQKHWSHGAFIFQVSYRRRAGGEWMRQG